MFVLNGTVTYASSQSNVSFELSPQASFCNLIAVWILISPVVLKSKFTLISESITCLSFLAVSVSPFTEIPLTYASPDIFKSESNWIVAAIIDTVAIDAAKLINPNFFIF